MIPLIAIAVGLLFLAISAVAFMRARARTSEEPDEASRLVLSFEDNRLIDGEPTPERMKKLAAICASAVRRIFNEELDYTPESIPKLERAIVSGWGSEDKPADQDTIITFGAYLGEVLVRRTSGRWVSGMSDDDPAAVMFLANGDEDEDPVRVSPFLLVKEKFDRVYGFDLSIAFTALEQKLRELKAV